MNFTTSIAIGKAIQQAAKEFREIFKVREYGWAKDANPIALYSPPENAIHDKLTEMTKTIIDNEELEFISSGRMRIQKWRVDEDMQMLSFFLEVGEVEI